MTTWRLRSGIGLTSYLPSVCTRARRSVGVLHRSRYLDSNWRDGDDREGLHDFAWRDAGRHGQRRGRSGIRPLVIE